MMSEQESLLARILEQKQDDIDKAIEAYTKLYNQELSTNELRKSVVSKMDYYTKELHINELYNIILQLKRIKKQRDNGE